MNPKSNLFCKIITISLFVHISISGSPPQIRFEHLTINDGLSQSSVRAILQDSYGFMWFGTQDGLNLYNGYEFEIFKNIKNDTTSISNNFINDLQEDLNGFIWIATDNGLNRFDHSTRKFKRIDLHDFFNNKSLSNSILSINATDTNVWFSTKDGVYKYNIERNSIDIYKLSSLEDDTRSDVKVSLFRTRSDMLWAITNMFGVYDYDSDSNIFKEIKFKQAGNSPLLQLNEIYEDSEGIFWFGSSAGLNKYNSKTSELITYKEEIESITNENITTNIINSITEDDFGNLWIATSGYGLIYLNKKSEEFVVYKNDLINEKSISIDVAHKVYKDRTGIIWIGTDGGGVDKMSTYLNHFSLVQQSTYGLSFKSVRSLFEDRYGNIWISGYNGLDRYNPQTNKYKQFYNELKSNGKTINDIVYSIIEDKQLPEKYLYFGTEGNGIFRYDISSERFSSFFLSGSSYGNNMILCMLDDGHNLWAGTYNGLFKINKKSGLYKKYLYKENDLSVIEPQNITSLFKDARGNFWIGTSQHGLLLMDSKNEKLVSLSSLMSNLNDQQVSLNIGKYIKCIFESNIGELWVGTTEGLFKINKDSKKVISYTVNDGLPNNVIYGILEDDSRNLWLSTNFGITVFNPIEKTFTNYDYLDGLQSNEFNTNAYMKSKSGTLYFGGIRGFNYFNPSKIEFNTTVPNIVFTDFYLFNKKIDVGEVFNNRVILERPITTLDTLVLNYSENVFTVYFSSLDFSAPGKNLYSHKLEGFNEEFSIPTSNRFVTYTNLNPGKYVLIVKGSNNNKLWNESGVSLVIIINPPFWLTWWFFVFVASVIIMILFSIYKYRINRILELERLRVKIASDLHDEVGATLTKVSMRAQMLEMQVNDEKEAWSLKRISEQSREAVSTMQDIVWAIDARNDDFDNLINKMKDTAYSILAEKDIKVNFSISGINSDNKIDIELRQNLYLILKESVHNVMKHSDATETKISLENNKDSLTMIISDNGKTFNQKEHYSGQGLRNIEMRAKKINAVCQFINENGFKVIIKAPPIL
ncbi:MAG: hypothetical protein K8F36_01965 [Melioribacteraceae bacterium]|nr:hypothetical protein [Melioribacteraceae bacterium]